jgi:hypothetical protein
MRCCWEWSTWQAVRGLSLAGARRLMLLSWVLVLLLMLAACGESVQQTGSPPTPQGFLTCGSITGHGAGSQVQSPRGEDPRPAEECFWQAFRTFQPARLDYRYFSIDSGTLHHFRIRPEQGRCLLSDAASRYTVPRPPQPAVVYRCRAVAREQSTYIVVGCGTEGDIPLPLPLSYT